MIDREVLKELGVTTMGHALAILKLAKKVAMLEGESFDFYTRVINTIYFSTFLLLNKRKRLKENMHRIN